LFIINDACALTIAIIIATIAALGLVARMGEARR
jgi:hypothetical protein